MKRPETHYARSGDVMIALQVTGEGSPVDLVWAPGAVSHLELDWEYPEAAAFYERLSSFVRLVRFDKRGTGMSDRPTDVATLEERIDDVRAVMDEIGSERAFIAGNSDGANLACMFAATYPGRTLGLILWGALARWTPTADHPWGIPVEEWEASAAHLAEHGPDDEYIRKYEVINSEEEMVRSRRYWRSAATPAAHAANERWAIEIDTRGILAQIHVPTLVMSRTEDPWVDLDGARDLANRIEGARFVEFPGDTHDYTNPDPEAVLAEIQEFVTGTRPPPPIDRVLTTVLFTDIVDSTKTAAELGDARWKKLLAEHDARARAEFARYGGIEIDHAGDGFLVRFDGPARGVRCARAIGETVATLGIEIRAGLHTGEVELTPGGVQGLAVHIGARVGALAGPSEVLVSSTVKDLVVGSGLAFEDAGEHELKGVPDRWHLYRVVS